MLDKTGLLDIHVPDICSPNLVAWKWTITLSSITVNDIDLETWIYWYIDIDIDFDDGENSVTTHVDNDKNNDKQPTIATINLWMSWIEQTHVWLPRAMIFWFLSIEKRTNQISQSWQRMLNDLNVPKEDSKPWSQSYVWLWLCFLPSSGLVLQTKVFSRQDRPEGVVNVKCVPSFLWASQDGEFNFLFTFSKVTCTWPGFQQTMVFSHDLERTKSPNQRQQST